MQEYGLAHAEPELDELEQEEAVNIIHRRYPIAAAAAVDIGSAVCVGQCHA